MRDLVLCRHQWLFLLFLLHGHDFCPAKCMPPGSLLSPAMGQFQGPALLSYNDGVFTEKDFESISRIGDSKKREQVGKTGRFG